MGRKFIEYFSDPLTLFFKFAKFENVGASSERTNPILSGQQALLEQGLLSFLGKFL
jgi:hypothetical protein